MKPLAYAFILLRDEGYPCSFRADYCGASHPAAFITNAEGWAEWHCQGGSVTGWVEESWWEEPS